jgi:hypothetical protein
MVRADDVRHGRWQRTASQTVAEAVHARPSAGLGPR